MRRNAATGGEGESLSGNEDGRQLKFLTIFLNFHEVYSYFGPQWKVSVPNKCKSHFLT